MVFLNFAALGVLCGLLLGGSFAALGAMPVRRLWLAYAAIVLQVAAFPSGVFPWSTPDDVARMRAVIVDGLEHGAWGVSAGLDYKPAYYAQVEEVARVVEPAATRC